MYNKSSAFSLLLTITTFAFLAVGGVIFTNIESAQATDTCPDGGQWKKIDGLTGLTYTFTPDPGYEVTANCFKAGSHPPVYGTGATVTNTTLYNSPGNAVCTAPGVPKEGCALQNISHASFKVALKTTPTPTPTPSTTPTPTPPLQLSRISPILECVVDNGDGSYLAKFGYETQNTFTAQIPVGNDNKVTGGGLSGNNQGQITEFVYPAVNAPSGRPGRSPYDVGVFSVTFDGSNLVWSLKSDTNRTATASKNSKACPAEVGPTPTSTPSVSPTPAPSSSPTPTPSNTPGTETQKTELSYSATCENDRVHANVRLTDNGTEIKGITVKLTYNNETKTVTTNDEGRAGESFGKAGNQVLRAEPDGFPTSQVDVVVEENCNGVGGISPDATIGQVLGASTISSFADTGSLEDIAAGLVGLAGLTFVGISGYVYVFRSVLKK